MESSVNMPEDFDVCLQQRTANEMIHLIRKLRWMGMEDEAKIMQAQLAAFGVRPGDNVVGGPRDTD